MTEVHLTFTQAAPTASLAYPDVVDWGHDMSQGIYIKLANGNEVIFNSMMVFAITVINEEPGDKGTT